MMNKLYIALAMVVFYCSPAIASVDPISDFFEEVFQQPAATQSYSAKGQRGSHRIHIDTNTGVNQMIADHVSSRIGAEWVPTALQIARIESGGRCGAVNASGATGVFQVMNPSRFGVSRSYARTCEGGIQAGVSHMAACIAKGAHTHAQMLICHNSGSPYGRVERAYRRYV
jgi:hypothetical protein